MPLYAVLLLLLDSFTTHPLPTLVPVFASFTVIVIIALLGTNLSVKLDVFVFVVFNVSYLDALTTYLIVVPDTYTVACPELFVVTVCVA